MLKDKYLIVEMLNIHDRKYFYFARVPSSYERFEVVLMIQIAFLGTSCLIKECELIQFTNKTGCLVNCRFSYKCSIRARTKRVLIISSHSLLGR